MILPPLPLPDERARYWLVEDREVRLIVEALLALACVPIGITLLFLLRGEAYTLTPAALVASVISVLPLIGVAAMRRPSRYLLTTHRIAEVRGGRFLWALRFDRISRIRRIGPTLLLRGAGRSTYSVSNIRQALWLENHLWERAET